MPNELDLTNKYNTPLTAQEMADYNTKFKPQDSYDYDMQGWYKANPNADPNGWFAERYHKSDVDFAVGLARRAHSNRGNCFLKKEIRARAKMLEHLK